MRVALILLLFLAGCQSPPPPTRHRSLPPPPPPGFIAEPRTRGNGDPRPLEAGASINWSAVAITPVEFFYAEDFTTGVKPAEWDEWSQFEYHSNTWAYASNTIAFGGGPYAAGAFCTFARGYSFNEVWLSFEFRCASSSWQILEVCDLYDTNRQEVCDTYLYPDGMLFLQMQNGAAWCETPVPVGQQIKIQIHYLTDGQTTIGELWWAYPDEEFGQDEFKSCAATGYYKTPIQKFLYGPVHSGGLFEYSRVRLRSTLPQELAFTDMTVTDETVTLSWNGGPATVEDAPEPAGPWSAVTNAASPVTLPRYANRFYRLSNPVSVQLCSFPTNYFTVPAGEIIFIVHDPLYGADAAYTANADSVMVSLQNFISRGSYGRNWFRYVIINDTSDSCFCSGSDGPGIVNYWFKPYCPQAVEHLKTDSVWNLSTMLHELGHCEVRIGEANSKYCADGVCTITSYGNYLDPMGNVTTSSGRFFNAFYSEIGGFIGPNGLRPVHCAEVSGDYYITDYESLSAGAKAVKVLKKQTLTYVGTRLSYDQREFYYLEVRNGLPIGPIPGPGVLVNTGEYRYDPRTSVITTTASYLRTDLGSYGICRAGQLINEGREIVTMTVDFWGNVTTNVVTAPLTVEVLSVDSLGSNIRVTH